MKHKNAKTLLRALTEIDDKYIEEAEGFRKAKIRKLPSVAQITGLAAACLVLLVGIPQYLSNQVRTEQSGAVMQTGNPWQEVSSIEEAEALTGFGLVLPAPKSSLYRRGDSRPQSRSYQCCLHARRRRGNRLRAPEREGGDRPERRF